MAHSHSHGEHDDSHEGHERSHGGHSHGGLGGHSHGGSNRRALSIALAITATYTVAEVVGGLITGSLALLADAAHMMSDNVSLGLALFAFWLSAKPPTPERSFGYKRAEILAALANGMTLVAISIWIFYEAYRRFQDPPEILGGWMMAVAVMGLLVNVAAALVLFRSESESLNLQGALRHIIADLLGSVGVIAAALIIILTGWYPADPLISVVIGLLVLGSSWKLLKDSTNILLEGTPPGIKAEEVGEKVVSVRGVEEVHDLHVWTITSGFPALAAHVLVGQEEDCHERRRELERVIHREFGIGHTTLQVDHAGDHEAEGPRLQFLPRIKRRDDRP
ncbi:Cadmium, cobalt and zinc/H(+)-K(+) antiporter [Rubrobacter xylanophilus DSM 9941]|uniref:cation diffusion facilitator family transporter n=1 Tax=Rubrobacter xylanophilus TaxID=49319 RepID=UPI001C63E312|nr:cation diffusion facilitator family transporter [Rubrobacter xylanophilus]QYJ14215.1 Cadmium, cobalt and zinc/H(+)-K(+) antiporter [Rubrobacter xylanophilus DSM 9941]